MKAGGGAPQARLFAAVELPEWLCVSLVAWARRAAGPVGGRGTGAGLRILEQASLHLTLCFLGARPAGEVGELLALLSSACEQTPPLELTLGAPAWLPPRRPRALAVEVRDASGVLTGLQGRVERALLGAGGQGARRYRPHVTVARCKPEFHRGRLALPVTPAERFAARSVCLMRSWLEPAGARYEIQGSVLLGDVS